MGAALTVGIDGSDNTGYQFDGNSHIALPNIISSTSDQLTVSGWFNASSLSGAQYLVYHGGEGEFLVGLYNNRIYSDIHVSTNNIYKTISPPIVIPNKWYHFAMVWEQGKRFELYLDGALVSSTTYEKYFNGSLVGTVDVLENAPLIVAGTNYPPSFGSYTSNPSILGDTNIPNSYYNGSLDEIRFHASALTQNEIIQLHNIDVASNDLQLGTSLTLCASAMDAEDGSLPDTSITWTTNAGTELGSGSCITHTPTATGELTIVAHVSDSEAASNSIEKIIVVHAVDEDNDGLSYLEEQLWLTNASVADTDGDGFDDGVEVTKGTNPTDASDFPDLWEIANGATIISHSGVIADSAIENMFGNSFGVEPNNTLFRDDQLVGFTHFVEWKSERAITLSGYHLAAQDDDSANVGDRGFTSFRLYGRANSSETYQLLDEYIPESNPYPNNIVDIYKTINEFSGQEFRAEFDQYASGSFPGVRVVDLSAIAR